MSLPTAFLEELRARTPLPALVGRRVRLIRSGRHHKGCCPFHGEKTPSFYVYADHFHCFGCGAHGDAISFIMQSEGTSFTEAVARLANEAGLSVPAPSPQAAAEAQRRHDLFAVLEVAQAHFRASLATPEAEPARAYLAQRALSPELCADWGIGFAPPGRTTLLQHLRGQTIEPAEAIAAGLLAEPEPGSLRPYFSDRITFPIRDRTGRIIGFGARTLRDQQPKYLNGPETDLFQKRHALFGLDRARKLLAGSEPLAVVEGYLDVIRLQQAGIAAVAPLGTALSEAQLDLLWSHCPVPVLCFDGDSAGARAAARTLTLALPRLTPERTLRIATLPNGEDPDSLTRAQGGRAMRAVLDQAADLADQLYRMIEGATPGHTPEARARLRQRLDAAAATIQNPALAGEMRRALRDRFFAAPTPRPARSGPGRLPARRAAPPPLRTPPSPPSPERLRNLIAILLAEPALLTDLADALSLLDLPPDLAALRDALLTLAADHESPLDSDRLANHLTRSGLAEHAARVLADRPLPSAALPGAMPAEAEARWWHFFNLLDLGGLAAQLAQAQQDFVANPCAETEKRLTALRRTELALRDIDPDDGPEPTRQPGN